MPSIRLKPHEERRLRAGHRWIFSNEIAGADEAIPDGGVAEVRDSRNNFLGMAYLNRHSLIAARLLTSTKQEIDPAFIARRVHAALALRRRVLPDARFGRILFGESDGLPGLVVDRYDGTLVVQIATLGMERLWPMAEAALRRELSPQTLYVRSDSPLRALEGLEPHCAFLGESEEPRAELVENGASFVVDVVHGQKTGWFYDQRENRAWLRNHVRGKRVLDAFCYTGGWAVPAALWGAAEVLGLDSSGPALELARENAARNHVEGICRFEEADLFSALREREQAGERFDVVVLDPPALIKSRARIQEGVRGYNELNRQAMRLLAPGGTLFTCSCSHLLPREEFLPLLSRSAQDARAEFRVAADLGQAPDHPVLLAMRETDYLKCAILERI